MDADQPISDGAVDERRGHGRVHSAGERTQDLAVRAGGFAVLIDSAPDLFDVGGYEVGRRPVLAGSGNLNDEVAQDVAAALGVDDFGVELDGVEAGRRVGG